ncbi:MAG: ATP-binding protein [Tenericutes bacterium]|nr:ATP-binding protein [Mycoplasmatota bacterium]
MIKLYKRELYLKKIRGFYNDTETIKVITGIRRCGKSSLLDTIIDELKEQGVKDKDIIEIKLDKRPNKNIKTPDQLDKLIESYILDDDFKYIFLDEIQNVKGFEEVIEGYRNEQKYSIFITGSNSYLLSGELVTKLTGRKIEIEMLPLNFYEYVDMKRHLNIMVKDSMYDEFEQYIREGGFPGALKYNNEQDRKIYVQNILDDIFIKDIKENQKIKNSEIFKNIQRYIINNFGSMLSASSIQKYYESININIDVRTIEKYIQLLCDAKIIYPCESFDIKSKMSLSGEKKYYLSDLSIYFLYNTDNRINYGPVLENILHNYLISKDYNLSVGKIGKLEVDFIARYQYDNYFYIQVSKNIDDEKTVEREYRPFYEIKDMYPRYLFLLDLIFKDNVDGIKNVNIVKFIAENKDL